jgi:autotransporter-associated beta strand protein
MNLACLRAIIRCAGVISGLSLLPAAAFFAGALDTPAAAAGLTWNGGNGTLAPSDSSGTWNYSLADWWNGAAGSVWTDGSNAVFGAGTGNGAAGTVTIDPTLASPLAPNSITFAPTGNGGAYTISGGSINVGSGNLPVTVNQSATIASQFVGAGGLTVGGSSVLTLQNGSSYAGPTIISSGTLQMTAPLANAFPGQTVAHYAFNGNTNDSSGNGLGATLQNGPATYTAGLFARQAISLDGSSQYLTVPYNAALALNAYTVSAWVNVNTQPAYNGASGGPAIFSTRNGGDATFDLQYYQYASGSYELHGDIGTGAAWLTITADYHLPGPLSGWNMITYTVNSSGYSIYVNGAQAASGTYSGTPLFMTAAETLSLGSQQAATGVWGAAGYLNGSLEDAYVFNSALSAAQVGSLYLTQYSALPGATTLSVSAGATWNVNGATQTVGGLAGAGNVSLGSGGALTVNTAGGSTFGGVISDSGAGGSLTVSGSGTLGLAGTNTYSGPTTVSGGTLDLLNRYAIQKSTLNLAGGSVVFDSLVASRAFSAGGLTGTGNLALQNNAATPLPVTLSVGGNNANTVYAGLLSGAGTLNKVGTGTLSLASSSSFSGGTILGSGTLDFASGALGTTHPVFAGGTLQYAVGNYQDIGSVLTNNTAPIVLDTNGNTVPLTNLGSTNTGGLTKLGAGVLGLVGASSYSGPTTIGGGTLQLGGPSAAIPLQNGNFAAPALAANSYIYYGSMTSGSQSALVWASSGNVLYSGTSGGALINDAAAWGYTQPYPNGNQAFSLQADSYLNQPLYLTPGTYTINWCQELRPGYAAEPYYFTLNGGTLGNSITASSTGWTTASQTFTISTAGSYSVGFLGGSTADGSVGLNDVAVWANGSGSLPSLTAVILTGSSAALNLNGATQTIGSLAGVAGSSVIDSGALISGNDDTNATFAGVISGSGSVSKIGTGLMCLSGPNTYTGPTTVSGGTLQIGSGTSDGSIASSSLVNNAAVVYNLLGGQSYSGVISGSGILVKSGTGTLTLAASNSFSGGTQLAAGTLNFGNLAALGSGTAAFTGNATLQAGVAGTVANNIAINPGVTGTLDTQANAVTLSGIVSGLGGLTKVGSGALTLSAGNTYSGATTIGAGSLLLSGAGNNNIPATSPVTVLSGGTLDVTGLAGGGGIALAAGQTLRGTGTVVGPVNVAAGSMLWSGTGNATGTGIGTLMLNGNVSFASGSALAACLGTPGASSLSPGNAGLINIQGNLTLPAGGLTVSLVNNSGAGGLGSLGAGYYELFAYTGTLSGTSANTFFVPGKQVVFTNQVNEPNAPNQIDAQVVSIVNFNWTGVNGGGGANSSWDTTTNSTNWASGAQAVSYQDGANVTFSDTNSVTSGTVSNANVVIQASGVQPNSVTFNNSAVNYTLSNSGGTVGIAGPTGITKSGSGTVFLQSANSFQGPVSIGAGIVNISNAAALGVSSSVSVASGTSLQLQGGLALPAMPLLLAGSGSAASPAALDSLSGTNSWAGPITLTGASTIAAAAGQLSLAGGVNNGGFPLTILGSGTATIGGAPGTPGLGISGSGGLTIGAGTTLNLAGTMSGLTNLTDSGALNLTAAAQTVAKFNGTAASSLTLNNTALTVTGPGVFSGSISGGGSLAISSSNLTLGGNVSLAGMNVNGALIVPAGGAVASGSAGLNLAVGGTGTLVTAGTISSAANTTIGSGAGGAATVYQTGGLVSQGGSGSSFYLGAAGGSGAYTISGGTLTANAASNVYLGGASAGAPGTPGPGAAILNLNGGFVQALGTLAVGNGTTAVNLNSGTLQAPSLSGSSNTAVNFNGGTLQATASSASFLGATPAANVNVYFGGVAIDTQGNNITISQPLNGAANSGISSVSISRSDTSTVFVTPPPVTFSGGVGSGGAAYATLNSAGHINGIVVTDPGSYSAAPTSVTVGNSTVRLSAALTLNGSGGLTKYGAGTLTLGGAASYGGPTVINAGTLQMVGAGQLPGGSALVLANSAALDLDGTSQTVASLSGGSGSLVTDSASGSNVTLTLAAPKNSATTFSGTIQNGAGIVNMAFEGNFISSIVLSGVNTFTGSATLGLGTVILTNSGALLDATLNAPAGSTMVVFSPSVVPHAFTLGGLSGAASLALADSASNPLALTIGGNNQNSIYTGALSGSGSITKVGTGTLTLGGSNSYTGGTTINSGELSLANSAAMPPTGNIVFAGGALQFTASNTADYSSQITSSTTPIALDTNGQLVTLNGGLAASNTAGLTKLGAGTLAMNGANSFGGPLMINGGELSLGNPAALPAGAVITFGGGALLYTAGNLTDYSNLIKYSASPIAIDTGGQNVTFAGVLDGSNSGGLTKLGAGTLALSGSNTYSGTTTVAAGVLQLQNLSGVPENSALSVSGGTFDLNGYSKNLNIISASPGGLITNQAAGTSVALNLSAGQGTVGAEYNVGTAFSDGSGTLSLAVSSPNGSGLQLTAKSTFGGGTNINASYVQMGNASALGKGTIAVSNSGYVELSWGSGPATVANSFSLDTAAIYAAGGYGTYTLAGAINLATSGALDGTPGNNLVVAGPITGPGVLFKGIPGGPAGGNVLTLTNTANSYQGGTTILSGTLAVTADAVLGPGSITFGADSTLQPAANNIVLNANRQIMTSTPNATLNAQNYTFTVASSIGGTGGLTITGGSAGVVVLSGNNYYTGTTNINGGTLTVASPGAILSSYVASNITFGGGTLQYTANAIAGGVPDYSGQIVNSTAPIAIDTNGQSVTFNYALPASNSGGLNKLGAGTLFLSGQNLYSGVTTISGGTLNLNNAPAIPSTITFAGGTLQYAAPATLVPVVDYSSVIKNSTAPMSIDTNGNSVTFNSPLDSSNTRGLTKIGAGTLVLASTLANSYGGPTVIQAGTLQLQLPPPITSVAGTMSFTSDTTSGIGASPLPYTEALAFNQGTALTINGVTFANANNAGGTGNLGSSWTFSPAVASAVAGAGNFPTGFQPVAGQGTYNLLNSFVYSGTSAANPNGMETLTVSGLVPGQSYDARLYYRAYTTTPPANRLADFTFISGSGTQTLAAVNEDLNSTGNYLDYIYTAGTNGVLTITESNNTGTAANDSWHWYGFSNQLLPSGINLLPTTTAISIAASSTLDLNGCSQQVQSLADFNPGVGVGSVINSNTAALTLTLSPTGGAASFGGTISGASGGTLGSIGLVMSGSGLQNLSGLNTYDLGTTVASGTLQLGNAHALGSGGLTANGGVLDLNGFSLTTAAGNALPLFSGKAGTITNSSATPVTLTVNQAATTTFGGTLQDGAGSGGLALVLTGSGMLYLSGANTYSGGTTISHGELQFANTGAMPSSGTVTVGSGATLTVNAGGPNEFTSGTSGPGTIGGLLAGPVVWNTGTILGIDTANASGGLTYAGAIANPGGKRLGLTKLGANELLLSGPNTYSGGTTISGGVLQFANTGAMPPSGTVTVQSGATLTVNAGGPNEFTSGTSGPGTLGSLLAGVGGQGAPVAWTPGTFLGIDTTNASGGTLTYAGDIANPGGNTLGLVKLGANTLVLSGTSTYMGGTTVLNGTLVFTDNEALADGTSLAVGGDLAAFGAAAIPPAAVSPSMVAAVPEPGTFVLLGVAGLIAAAAARRRRTHFNFPAAPPRESACRRP